MKYQKALGDPATKSGKLAIKKSAYLKYPSKDRFATIPNIKIDFFEKDLFNPFLFSKLAFAKLFPTT